MTSDYTNEFYLFPTEESSKRTSFVQFSISSLDGWLAKVTSRLIHPEPIERNSIDKEMIATFKNSHLVCQELELNRLDWILVVHHQER